MADNKITIKIVADTAKAGQQMREFGERLSQIGTRMSAAFTLPIVGAFAAALQSSVALQGAVKPLQDAFKGVATELGNALVPIVKELTPYILNLAKSLMDVVKQFEAMPDWQKKFVLGFVGFAAIIGPVIFSIGQLVNTMGTLLLMVNGPGFASALVGIRGFTVATWAAVAPVVALAAAITALYTLFRMDEFKKLSSIITYGAKKLTGSTDLQAAQAAQGNYNMMGGGGAGTTTVGNTIRGAAPGLVVNVNPMVMTGDKDQVTRSLQPIIAEILRALMLR